MSFAAYAWPIQNAYIRDCAVKVLSLLPFVGPRGKIIVHFFDLGFRFRFALLIGYIFVFMSVRALREAVKAPLDMKRPWYEVVESFTKLAWNGFWHSAAPLTQAWFCVSRRVAGLVVPTAIFMAIIGMVKLLVFGAVELSHAAHMSYGTALASFCGGLCFWLVSPAFGYATTRLRWTHLRRYYENQLRGIGLIYATVNSGFVIAGISLWLLAFVVAGTQSSFLWRDALLQFNNPYAAHMLWVSSLTIVLGVTVGLLKREFYWSHQWAQIKLHKIKSIVRAFSRGRVGGVG